jgi:hypothetical protein
MTIIVFNFFVWVAITKKVAKKLVKTSEFGVLFFNMTTEYYNKMRSFAEALKVEYEKLDKMSIRSYGETLRDNFDNDPINDCVKRILQIQEELNAFQEL